MSSETPKKKIKSGTVSIIGRPNVGKSTLLNTIVGEKVAIVSKIPQTTRHQIRGIYTDERGQIIFIDTPGIHQGKDKLDHLMNQTAAGVIDDTDVIVYLADVSRRVGQEEKFVAEKISKCKAPVIYALNKVDLGNDRIPEYIAHWETIKGKPVTEMKNFTLIALSATQDKNVDKLIDIIFDYLPEGPLLYPADTVTDVPQRLAISDMIREKFLLLMKDEVPHSISVVIEAMEPRKKKTVLIKALVLVERESHKEIVIGKRGHILKTVGTQARMEIEQLLDAKVFLELHVKVQEHWRDDLSLLKEYGYFYG